MFSRKEQQEGDEILIPAHLSSSLFGFQFLLYGKKYSFSFMQLHSFSRGLIKILFSIKNKNIFTWQRIWNNVAFSWNLNKNNNNNNPLNRILYCGVDIIVFGLMFRWLTLCFKALLIYLPLSFQKSFLHAITLISE